VPDPDRAFLLARRTPDAPGDPEVPRSGAPGWPDPLPTLEHDREVLAWLQCSTQLSGEVTGYLCDALLDWALSGRGYPQMGLPEAGPTAITCWPFNRSRAVPAPDRGGPDGRGQARAWSCRPAAGQGVPGVLGPAGRSDAFDRELLMAMPWLAAPPAAYRLADGSWV
jgi:hypothetical protein